MTISESDEQATYRVWAASACNDPDINGSLHVVRADQLATRDKALCGRTPTGNWSVRLPHVMNKFPRCKSCIRLQENSKDVQMLAELYCEEVKEDS